MTQPTKTRRPDYSDGNLAIYHVVPEGPGKKTFFEIYDGPPEAKTKAKIFPDVLGTNLDIYQVRDLFRGDSLRITGYKRGTREPYAAFICSRRIKVKDYEKEPGVFAEDRTVELGIAYPKETFNEKGKGKELIGYRLWTGPGQPLVDFFSTAGSHKQVKLTARNCFELFDGKTLEISNHRVKMVRVVETLFEGKPTRVARVSTNVIKRQRGANQTLDAAQDEEPGEEQGASPKI